MDTQMSIIQKCQWIETHCRPHIYQKHLLNIMAKYPKETNERYKELAKEKTEKTIRKYSY
jgi:hypothetical protein